MTRLAMLSLALAVVALGCAANPVRPSCGGWRLALANVGTLGGWGLGCSIDDEGDRFAIAQQADVKTCVAEGGDPAACRAAIYAPRQPTHVTVNAVTPAPPLPTYLGPRNAFGVPVGAVPVFPVR
jgi:hypothetical protein